MNKYFYIYLVIFVFFVSPNILTTYGFDIKRHDVFLFVSVIIALLFNKSALFYKNKFITILVLFQFIVTILKLIIDRSSGVFFMSINFIGAGLVFSCFPYRISDNLKRLMFKLILAFFIVECSLAIFERITTYNIFVWRDNAGSFDNYLYSGDSMFRSFGLMGHPLQNALIVSTIMSFILISQMNYKYNYWFLGFLAVLCFNARAALVLDALMLLVYLLYTFTKRNENLIRNLSYVFIFVICTFYALFSLNWGGRIMNYGVYDEGSAGTRINTLELFRYYSLYEFLWGSDSKEILRYLDYSGIIKTENFWVDYLLRYGLIVLILVSLLYILVIKSITRHYTKFEILFTSLFFLLIASTNNSLTSTWIPLFLLLFCYFVFYQTHKPSNKIGSVQ